MSPKISCTVKIPLSVLIFGDKNELIVFQFQTGFFYIVYNLLSKLYFYTSLTCVHSKQTADLRLTPLKGTLLLYA